jgi:hypothetical protein
MIGSVTYDIVWNASCDGASVHAKLSSLKVGEETLELEQFKKRYPKWQKELDLDGFVDVFYENVVDYGMPDHEITLAGREFHTEDLVEKATWDDPEDWNQVIVEIRRDA